MKIISVEIFDIHTNDRPTWHPVFVRINTDEGVSGVGEAGLAYDWGHSAAANLINEIANALLIGFDPFNTELLWNKMLRNGFWGLGGGPVFYAAMSAIDTALWDIKAKSLNLPLYKLIGGKVNNRLRAYASQLQFDWDSEVNKLTDPKQYREATRKALDQGYTAVKVNPFFYDKDGNNNYDLTKYFSSDLLKLACSRVEAIRDEAGMDVDIYLECHSMLGINSAIEIGQKVAMEYNCKFMEEPVNYLNAKLHDKIYDKLDIPIAMGERVYLRHGVRDYLENQTVDILQPDIGLCGGVTEALKICAYADMYDVQIQVHVCGGPVATAVALHIETAIPNFYIHEHHTYAIKNWNRELCIQDYQPLNGYISVPELPGIGIELNNEIVIKSKIFEVK